MESSMRVFVKVVECGSFSKAGKALSLSPSAVSRQIAGLEESLGAQLFRRSTRQTTLTAAGQTLFERVSRLIHEIDQAAGEVRALCQQAPRGDIRVSVFETFGRLHVCPILPEFLYEHPDVRVEVMLDNKMANLYRDEVDIAIRIGSSEDSRLKARLITQNRMMVCASPRYLERQGVPQTPADLARHNCLTLSRARQLTYWYFHKGAERQKVSVTGSLASVGGTPLVEAACGGLGITMLADWVVADNVERGALVPLLQGYDAHLHERGSGDIYLVFLNDPYMRPALRALVDFLCRVLPLRCAPLMA